MFIDMAAVGPLTLLKCHRPAVEPDFPGAAIVLGHHVDVVRGCRLAFQRTLGQIGLGIGIDDATNGVVVSTTAASPIMVMLCGESMVIS